MQRNINCRPPWILLLLAATACFGDPPQAVDLESSTGDTQAEASMSDSTAAGPTGGPGGTDTQDSTGSTTEHGDATTEASDVDTSGSSSDTGQDSGVCANLGFLPLICTDFDDSLSIPDPWIATELSGVVSVSEISRAPSPPNALRATGDHSPAGTFARISTELAMWQPEYAVSFRLHLGDGCGLGTVAQISFPGDASSVFDVDLRLSAVEGELIVFNGAGEPGPVPLDGDVVNGAGAWAEVRIELTAATGAVRVYINDAQAGGVSLPPAEPPMDPPTVHIGLAHKVDTTCTAVFDDIIIR
jgi:hypothetical protein